MKDHLKKYFPERFGESNATSFSDRVFRLFNSAPEFRMNKKCQQAAQYVFERSDELRLLAGAMKKYGCNFNLERHVSCEKCNNCAGGFDPDTKQIILNSSMSSSKDKILATMMHEMVHMFDYCRAKFDFENLEHVACTEIRAANLTYCSLADRLAHGGPGMLDLKMTHQYCVKDIAFQSVKAYSPETSDHKVWEIVDKVFLDCYNDLEPFGRRPTSGMRNLKQSYRERYHYGYA